MKHFEPIDPALLLSAYAQGIFPMADGADDPSVHWVEPRLRAILPLDGFHLSHSLKKIIVSDRFRVTTDSAFADMVALCAAPADDRPTTWINPVIKASYDRLFQLGHAHSVECWQDGALVGGLYGVTLGRAFFGESMVSRARDASKVALAHLVARLMVGGWKLLDCQFITPHLASLGAIEIRQADYLARLYSVLAGGDGGAALGAGARTGGGATGGAVPSPPFAAGDWDALDAFGAAAAPDFGAERATGSPPGYVIAQLLTKTS
ncbi:leucyl/phenylalanyl-tRNA--protein transferase [Sphingopyxis sp. RIFCSPHIGHO2_12_FULL_65_19]|uniref:leucyl/phenylalanyl-tRNA--protein transferase n=1 Tax=Sphingopyxis sp. RIFCSPHIGHO2_12_FULL_65_19 TaxID=1802172 RepID=UPI0008D7868F|nr:leucyl/phenylalanyl-tRNA--protein transferase [Sphingopyxis sp. RIFCSPHIGHO2_12_FULL_65_19]OHD05454.1 MAG: leucyl/phenylalanyl-tRNA--protein transferase [Sphingopyxis sp. RIFCSPHIGHO2_12_FULL_65_19]